MSKQLQFMLLKGSLVSLIFLSTILLGFVIDYTFGGYWNDRFTPKESTEFVEQTPSWQSGSTTSQVSGNTTITTVVDSFPLEPVSAVW